MEKKKIFVTLGSQEFQFNRLLKVLDDKLLNDEYEIFAQRGHSDYIPKFYKTIDFVDRDAFLDNVNKADIIITHAGTGAIISALKANKPVIAVARLAKYNEHVDNHQTEILKVFSNKNYIYGITEIKDIKEELNKALSKTYDKFISNTDNFVENLIELIER